LVGASRRAPLRKRRTLGLGILIGVLFGDGVAFLAAILWGATTGGDQSITARPVGAEVGERRGALLKTRPTRPFS